MPLTRRTVLGAAAGAALLPAAARAQQPAEIGTAARPLRLGVTAGVHAQIAERVRAIAARPDGPGQGLVLRLFEFTEYIRPNAALAEGDLDANSYQHLPFLEQQRRDRGYRLAAVGKSAVFPMGLYSKQLRSVDALERGARVAIPNDPTNGGRALLLLASKGVLTLRQGVDFRATVADIADNPKRLRIVELEAPQLPRTLDEVALAAINTDFAMAAGLNPVRDSLAIESSDSPYANLLVVREADQHAPWVARLVASYQNDEIRSFLRDTFNGAAVPAF